MDITPLINDSKKIITSYGNNKFIISGVEYNSNVIIINDQVYEFGQQDHLTNQDFQKLIELNNDTELLIVGTGQEIKPITTEEIINLRKNGINADIMSSSAAVRTFNVLNMEDRKVAAIILAV